MAEGDFPKIDGDILFSSEVNTFHNRILEIYTGTDLNGGTVGSLSHELSATTFSIVKPNYLKIQFNSIFSALCDQENESSSVALKIEVKDIGGSYIEVFNRIIASSNMANGTSFGKNSEKVQFVEYLHTLTSNEKANGFQIKLTTTIAETNGSASFTNDQIIVEQVS